MTDGKRKEPSAKEKAGKVSRDSKTVAGERPQVVQGCTPEEVSCDYCKDRKEAWSFDRAKPSYRRREIQKAFPKVGDDFEILEPASGGLSYNCLAHALGFRRIGVDLGLQRVSGRVRKDLVIIGNEIQAIYDLLKVQGYQTLPSLDLSFEEGKTKVAMTYEVENGITMPIHYALQLSEGKGTWTAKLGFAGDLIRHRCLCQLEGSEYAGSLKVFVLEGRPDPKKQREQEDNLIKLKELHLKKLESERRKDR